MVVIKFNLGKKGEEKASKFLIDKGYKIVENNFRVSGVEIDIIAKKDNFLCFIEVKTRTSNDFGFPEEFVDFRKRQKIIRGAKIFSAKKPFKDFYKRFDIISVLYKNKKFEINHIENAFEE